MNKIHNDAPARAVIFDLGNVLVEFDYRITAQRLLAQSRIGAAELQKLIDQSPLLLQYETGLVSTEEFFVAVQAAAGFRGDLEAFRELFGDIFRPIPPMVALQTRLRQLGVPTYILSNTNELAVQDLRKRHAFFHGFDGYVFSFEHRAMKPDPRLYQVAERVAGYSGPDLLYVDDLAENIDAARNRGWRAFVHESPEATRIIVERELSLAPD